MKFFKRSIISIIRKPSKSLLLFLIVFLLGNLVCGSYAIMQSTISVRNDIKQKLGALITIHANDKLNDEINDYLLNYENKIVQEMFDITDIFENISDNEDIQYSDYMYEYPSYESRDIVNPYEYANYSEVEDIDPLVSVRVMGVIQPNFGDIKYERISITEGRTFTEEEINQKANVIILNENFKSVNDTCEYISREYDSGDGEYYYVCNREQKELNIGDKITLVRQLRVPKFESISGFGYYDVFYEVETEYEIIGFYKNLEELRDNSFTPSIVEIDGKQVTTYTSAMDTNAYVPLTLLIDEYNEFQPYVDEYRSANQKIRKSNYIFLNSMSIDLNDPDKLDMYVNTIKKEYADKGFINFEFFTSRDTYDVVAGPVESLSTIANIVLIVSIIVSVVILTLVIVMFLKDRKHEIGIYVSLGEKKWKMITQIVLEVFIISMLAVSLSLLSGIKLGSVITDQVLESSLMQEEETMQLKLEEIGSVNRENLQIDDVTEQITFTLDATYVISVYGISIVVILLSSIIPVMYVLRIEPKKILM